MPDQPQSTDGNRTQRALLIGINKYPNLSQIRWLRGCVNDILEVRKLLVEHAGFPPENVRLLLSELDSRTLPADIGTVEAPSAAKIREALTGLSDGIQRGDEVVLYYSGHGVRIANPQNPAEQIGAVTSMDVQFANGALAPETLIINREMNKAIQSLLAAGATVTTVIDACHSGGATRDLDEDSSSLSRELVFDVSPEGWQQLVSYHNVGAAELAEGERSLDGGGWATSLADQQNLIVLSGCRDVETSKEWPRDQRLNGALTFFLIDALKNVPEGDAARTTWQDVYPRIRQAVLAAYPDQTPTLEGRGERPLFGGKWSPYAPGFTISVGASGLQINGGTMHGLGPGAELAVYPPKTADFKTAAEVAVVQVDSADLIAASGHVISGSATLEDQSRARLIKPAAAATPLGVQLTNVPKEIEDAIRQVEGLEDFICLNPTPNRPEFEVRPNPAASGYVIVPYVSGTQEPSPNDVIASAPGLDAEEPQAIGFALGQGLVHWAKYWAVLTRRNTDTTLQGVVTLTLLQGTNPDAMFSNPNDPANAAPVKPNASGVSETIDTAPLMVKVKVGSNAPGRLFTGLLVCANDGSITVLWPPPNADNYLDPGGEKIVGLGSDLKPFNLTVDRPEQTEALFTFKAIATNATGGVDLSSLEQEETVQMVIDAQFAKAIKAAVPTASSPRVLWTTVEMPVAVKRAA